MKNHKEILAGIIIAIVGFVLAIVVAILIVESNAPSSASNDGWLGFLGGLFGSFISGIITFWVLYVNRNDMEDGDGKRQRVSEMDKMENDLKDAFALIRIDRNCVTAKSYFCLYPLRFLKSIRCLNITAAYNRFWFIAKKEKQLQRYL